MIGVQREQDFRDDVEVVSSDGVSFQFNKAHLVALCPALVTIIGSCKEETSKLVLDFNTETLESFYDLLHLGEGCINGNDHLLDLKQLLLNLGVQEDQLSASVIDDIDEVTTTSSFQDTSQSQSLRVKMTFKGISEF